LLVVRREVEEKDGVEVTALRSNTILNIDMAKPLTFMRGYYQSFRFYYSMQVLYKNENEK